MDVLRAEAVARVFKHSIVENDQWGHGGFCFSFPVLECSLKKALEEGGAMFLKQTPQKNGTVATHALLAVLSILLGVGGGDNGEVGQGLDRPWFVNPDEAYQPWVVDR